MLSEEYLLGTGKVQLTGANYDDLPLSAFIAAGSSSGGGESSGVSQEYVDNADAVTLRSAKNYTDSETAAAVTEVKGYVDESIPTELPATKIVTHTAVAYASHSTTDRWVAFYSDIFKANGARMCISLKTVSYNHTLYSTISDNSTGILDIIFQLHARAADSVEICKMVWEIAPDNINLEDFKLCYYIEGDGTIHLTAYINCKAGWDGIVFAPIINNITGTYSSLVETPFIDYIGGEWTEAIPSEYTTVISSTVMPLLNTQELQNEVSDLKAYIRRLPRDIQIVERTEPRLNVRTGTHFRNGGKEYLPCRTAPSAYRQIWGEEARI